jgi:phosphoglycolate phosphatase-like HAD superfamily hydrolase
MRPGLLVLDFDGVVCDGIDEMVETSRRTLAALTGGDAPAARRAELHTRFAALRPAIESGWEMVALYGLLLEQDPAGDAALRDVKRWAEARDAYLHAHGLARGPIASAFDDVRARWMAANPREWLTRHRFYPGIADWLRQLLAEEQAVYILSTKGKPFLEALLAWQTVPIPPGFVIGRAEPKREKWEVMRELLVMHAVAPSGLWFVEDRLATLLDMRRHATDLAAARLFLVDWGYVFADRDPPAARAAGIPVLTLPKATGPFDGWLAP